MRVSCTSVPVIWDELTAYFYGYFVGDGSMSVRRSKNGGQLCIASTDYEHIVHLQRALGIQHIIFDGVKIYNGYIGKPQYRLIFTKKEWYEFFESMGIVQAKSRVDCSYTLPPGEYFYHFLRGLSDSDGCITDERYPSWNVFGTETLIRDIQCRLPFDTCILYHNVWRVGTHCKQNLVTLRNLLYSNATFYLARKRDLFYKIK